YAIQSPYRCSSKPHERWVLPVPHGPHKKTFLLWSADTARCLTLSRPSKLANDFFSYRGGSRKSRLVRRESPRRMFSFCVATHASSCGPSAAGCTDETTLSTVSRIGCIFTLWRHYCRNFVPRRALTRI